MKKAISLILASAMLLGSVGLTGCDLLKKFDKNAWIEEASKKVDDELNADNCTEFYLNGEMYTFPCNISELLDNGWEFVAPSDAKEEVEAGHQSEYIYSLTDADEHTIKVGVTNISDETLKTSECEIDSLEMDSNAGELMIAGGIAIHNSKYDSLKDLKANIDMDSMEFEIDGEGETTSYYKRTFENENGYTVTLSYKVWELESSSLIESLEFTCKYFKDYDFIDDINGTISAIFSNDPSYLNPDYFTDTTPEEYVDSWRGNTGLPYLVSYMMGFVFTEFNDEQMAKLDAIIAINYELNTYTIVSLETDKALMTFQYYDFFDILDKAYAALYETDIDYSNSSLSEECFDFVCDKMLELYNNRTDNLIFPTATTYDAINSEDSEVWYDILYLQLGMADLLEE